jgi:NtrC-family two-component system sensor histidine kinase KinB
LPDEPYRVRAVLGVPIWSGGQVRGILTLQHREPQHFTQEHLKLIQAAANQMALALTNAQNYEAQRRAAEQRRRMYEVLRSLGGWFGVDALVRAAVQAISRYTSWTSVDIALLDEQQPGMWSVRGATSTPDQPRDRQHSIDEGVIGRALRTGRLQYIPDVRADPDYVTGHANTGCELAVPLLRGERVVGALNLESERVDGFNPDEIALAESLAEVVVLALDNARLYQAIADERSRLQALIDASRDGVLLAGADRIAQVVNAAALALLGLPGEREAWLGRPVDDLLATLREQAPAASEAIQTELARLLDTELAVVEGAYDLGALSVRWVALPVYAQDLPIGHLLVLHNMTQERQLERLREDLTHTMVHDLRNPLTAMMSSVDLFAGGAPGPLNEVQAEIIDIMRLSVKRMLELVNAILDVSRLESGAMPVERRAVDLSVVSVEVLRLEQPLAGARHIRLMSEIAPDLPVMYADLNLTARVLQNLIGNAIKFAPEGSTVWIAAVREDEGGVRVSVHDEGLGIPPELHGRLFQRFVTGAQRGRGSGLGLAFCRLAVEAQGGRIWVESSPDSGATFVFTLPAAGDGAQDSAPP